MEEKEQFLQSLELFKGYNFAFLANILMNIKKKIYNFDDIIYEEGSDTKKMFFIKSGEVELSKKVVIKNQDVQLNQQNEIKKQERVVMAQKQANEWFGEVEIMQNMKRFTRARCVSAKLEVFYISALKFFANLNIEEMIKDMKKSSSMIDNWRQKHYDSMVNRIYNSKRDPLRKTFQNLQVAHDLINEKFKTEFMKVKPQTIVQPNKVEETNFAAKIVYFNTVKTYVSKISDVIGTISKLKLNQEANKKEEKKKNKNEIQRRKEQLQQLRSQSLPRYAYPQSQTNITNNSQNDSIVHKRVSSQVPSEANSPIRLPKLPMADYYEDFSQRKSVTTNKSQQSINLNKSQLSLQNDKLPQLHSPQVRHISQQNHSLQIQQNQTPQNTDREKVGLSQFSSPSHQKIKLTLNKKVLSNLGSQNEIDEFTGRNSITQLYPQTTPHTSCTLNHIQSSKPQFTDRVPTDQEFLENLYDGIVHNKQKKQLIFNKEMNQKIVEEGMRKKNLQMHQSKQHGEDFSNLLNRLATQVGITKDDLVQDKAKKLKLFRKLKLDNILDYKYQNQMKIQQAQKRLSLVTDQSVIQNEQIPQKEAQNPPLKKQKFLNNQTPLLPTTFSSKIIPTKAKLTSAQSLSQLYSPLSRNLHNKNISQHGTPSHYFKK